MTKIGWAQPDLTNPIDIELTPANQNLRLRTDQDYRLRCGEALTAAGGLIIAGGRNVVLVGGKTLVPDSSSTDALQRRALYVKDATGIVHIEGVDLDGVRLGEGINISAPLATVRLQNVKVAQVHGMESANHADGLQAWAGPKTLQLDRVVISTNYQGMFLLPHQHAQLDTSSWEFRNVDITGTDDSGYMLWKEAGLTVTCSNVHVRRGSSTSGYKLFWPDAAAWPGASFSAKALKTFTATPGIGYVTPV